LDWARELVKIKKQKNKGKKNFISRHWLDSNTINAWKINQIVNYRLI
jgi:hypothetical protein